MINALRMVHRHRASVVLAGHEHNYEQFSRHDPNGAPAKENGVRSFIVGTGGALLTQTNYEKLAPNSENVYGESIGVLKIDLYAKRYEWEFFPVAGVQKPVFKRHKDDCIPRP